MCIKIPEAPCHEWFRVPQKGLITNILVVFGEPSLSNAIENTCIIFCFGSLEAFFSTWHTWTQVYNEPDKSIRRFLVSKKWMNCTYLNVVFISIQNYFSLAINGRAIERVKSSFSNKLLFAKLNTVIATLYSCSSVNIVPSVFFSLVPCQLSAAVKD